jgi:hypothetical protein
MRFILRRAFREKFNNHVTAAKKTSKIGQFFTSILTFSFAVTKRLKTFENFFLRLPLGCYIFQKMYLSQFRTFWFKISHGSMERQKGPILTAIANGKSYGQSLYVVQIGNPCVPIRSIARI